MKDGYRIIDADSHILETADVWDKYLPEGLRSWPGRPQIWTNTDGTMLLTYEGYCWPAKHLPAPSQGVAKMTMIFTEGTTNPTARVKDMDFEGRDVDVVFPTTALTWWWYEAGGHGTNMCRAYNDWLANYCRRHPERLKGVGVLPLYSPTEAVRELDRMVYDLDMVGAAIPVSARAKRMDERITLEDESLYPVYEKAQELSMPICIHPAIGPQMPAFQEVNRTWYQLICAGFAIQIELALTSLISGGLFDRFPKLRFGLFEGTSGWIPAWMDMMQDFWENEYYNTSVPEVRKSPWEYAKSDQLYVSVECGEPTLADTIRRMGGDSHHLMYSSDYGHVESEYPNTIKKILEHEVSEVARRRLVCENAKRFYRNVK